MCSTSTPPCQPARGRCDRLRRSAGGLGGLLGRLQANSASAEEDGKHAGGIEIQEVTAGLLLFRRNGKRPSAIVGVRVGGEASGIGGFQIDAGALAIVPAGEEMVFGGDQLHRVAEPPAECDVKHGQRGASAGALRSQAAADEDRRRLGEELLVGGIELGGRAEGGIVSDLEVLADHGAHHGEFPLGFAGELLGVLQITVVVAAGTVADGGSPFVESLEVSAHLRCRHAGSAE